MNRAIIIGNIATDLETRTTQSGVSVTTFRVAVQRERRNQNGTYDADFLPVVAWRYNSDYVSKYLHKGSKIAVEGSIQTRSYDAQDGSKRFVTEIIADRVEGLDRRENTQAQPAQPVHPQKPAEPAGADDFTEVDDDSLPFD